MRGVIFYHGLGALVNHSKERFFTEVHSMLDEHAKKYGDAKDAVEQITSRQYAQKYESYNKPIYLIGMSFDEKQRNMADLWVEKV